MESQNRVHTFLTRKSLPWLNFLIDVLSVLVSFPNQSHEKKSRGASFQLGLSSVNLSQVKNEAFSSWPDRRLLLPQLCHLP